MFWKKKIAHPTAPNLYAYKLGERPNAGAENFVFLAPFALPVQLIRGAGSFCGSLRVTQSPQVMVSPATTTVGQGGYPTGQIALQQLQDNSGGQ